MHLQDVSDNDIAALPLDRLALKILVDYQAYGEWNWRNWMLAFATHRTGGDNNRATFAAAEAWQWILANALVARTPSQGATEAVFVTRFGNEVLARGVDFMRATQRISTDLMPELEAKVRPQYLLGDYELAALAAMREVEIAVRERANLDPKLIGTDLMRQAFKVGGPLADPAASISETEAQASLYAGAVGLFKNPLSHRRVDYTDPIQASEIVILADLLLRTLKLGQSAESPQEIQPSTTSD